MDGDGRTQTHAVAESGPRLERPVVRVTVRGPSSCSRGHGRPYRTPSGASLARAWCVGQAEGGHRPRARRHASARCGGFTFSFWVCEPTERRAAHARASRLPISFDTPLCRVISVTAAASASRRHHNSLPKQWRLKSWLSRQNCSLGLQDV